MLNNLAEEFDQMFDAMRVFLDKMIEKACQPLRDRIKELESGEPEAQAHDDIKQQIRDACSGGYQVKIVFRGCVRSGVVTSAHDNHFFLQHESKRAANMHSYQPVQSVERIVPDVAKERCESEKEEGGAPEMPDVLERTVTVLDEEYAHP